MPVTHEIWLKTDLKRPITVQPLRGLLFSADNQGDKVGFEVYEDGTPVTLSGVITGYIIKNNGETVVVSGSFDGNRAWIVCPANAYDAIGPVYIAIKNRASTATTAVTTTLGMCTTYVERTATGEIVTPTYKIVDAATIANMITQMETATAAANTAASAANTAANKLENMDAAASTLAPESAATANVTTVSGHYRINLGLPKGDTGDNAAITGVTTSYATNDSASTVPADSAFGPTPPTVPQGNYLWTKTTLTWNNGQTTILNLPSRQGRDGSGSVSSVNNVSPDNNGNVALPIDAAPTDGSSNPVSSDGVYDALAGKQDTLTIDAAPTADSTNPVSSGGAYTALDGKVSKVGDTMTGDLVLTKSSDFPSLTFSRYTNSVDGPQQMIQANETGTSSTMTIYQRINGDSAWEGFRLPNTTESITGSNKVYEILTSKTFNPGEDFTSKISFAVGENNCKATRQGNICVIEYQSNGFTGSDQMTLFTLPVGYRPTVTTYFGTLIDTSLVPALIELSTTGTVKLYKASSYPAGKRIYLNFSYSCN